MATISSLPALSTAAYTSTILFPVVNTAVYPPQTNVASVGNLINYVASAAIPNTGYIGSQGAQGPAGTSTIVHVYSSTSIIIYSGTNFSTSTGYLGSGGYIGSRGYIGSVGPAGPTGSVGYTGSSGSASQNNNLISVATQTTASSLITFPCTAGTNFWIYSPTSSWQSNFTGLSTNNIVNNVNLIISQSSTAYITTSVYINGILSTVNWKNNTIPTPVPLRINVIGFTIINSNVVLGELTSY